MRRFATIRFLKGEPKFECVYPGQTAKLWKINSDGSLYVELKCGHPHTVTVAKLKEIELVEDGPEEPEEKKIQNTKGLEPAKPVEQKTQKSKKSKKRVKQGRMTESDSDKESDKEEIPMATKKAAENKPVKQAAIPDAKGAIPVQGYEKEVTKFKTDLKFFERLEKDVKEQKETFRSLAAQVLESVAGQAKAVEFLSDDGSRVPVTMPDVSKAGNRTSINIDDASEVAKLGFDLDELGVTETESTFTLTGPFVDWMRAILQEQYVAKGIAIPAGVDEKTVKRLSEGGVEKLRVMAKEGATDNEKAAAKYLLTNGIKAAQVTAK